MDGYLAIKLLHILSSTILFGTGIGTAFFMLRAYHGGDANTACKTAGTVVVADWLFTTPAVVLQLATGLWLTNRLGISWQSVWFVTVLGLFVFVGVCWLPVVWIQIRVRNMLRAGAELVDCRRLMTTWTVLGVCAFAAVIVIFLLMVYKPWLGRTL
jgi:uncharacterized membrane protein